MIADANSERQERSLRTTYQYKDHFFKICYFKLYLITLFILFGININPGSVLIFKVLHKINLCQREIENSIVVKLLEIMFKIIFT